MSQGLWHADKKGLIQRKNFAAKGLTGDTFTAKTITASLHSSIKRLGKHNSQPTESDICLNVTNLDCNDDCSFEQEGVLELAVAASQVSEEGAAEVSQMSDI